MIPIVDARTGKLVEIGKLFSLPPTLMLDGTRIENSFTILAVKMGLFSGQATVRTCENGREHIAKVGMPIRWFPRLTYGPAFPVSGLRAAIFPS